MADNVAITAGSGTTIAADDVGGVLSQRVKVQWGPDGTVNDADVATGKPIPVQVRSATGLIPIGEPTDAKSTATDATSVSAISLLKQQSASLQTLSGALISPGQAAMASSSPVVLASDQTWAYAAGIGKAEDVASANADVGVPAMAVRKATPANTSGTDGDYEMHQIANGKLWVQTGAYSAAATATPAASSHVANDVHGGALTFSTMGPSAGRIMINSASLEIDGATAEATTWRLYLYNVTPPSATADDGAWDLVSGDRASFLGYVDLGTAIDLGSTQWVETHGIGKQLTLAGTDLFGYLVNATTLTPANVAHIITLHSVAL